MTHPRQKDSIVELDYADKSTMRPRHRFTLCELASVAGGTMLFIHIAATLLTAAICFIDASLAEFKLAPGQSLGAIPLAPVCFVRNGWYAMMTFFVMDLAVIASIVQKSRQLRRIANSICAIGLTFVTFGILTLWGHPPIQILTSGMVPETQAILNTGKLAGVAALGVAPSAVWLTCTIVAAIRSQPPAPSLVPES